MTDLNDKHIAVLRKAAAAVKDRGHEGDARLADSVLGIVASVSARTSPAPRDELDELGKAIHDAVHTGTGVMLGGRHVPESKFRATPAPQAAPSDEQIDAVARQFLIHGVLPGLLHHERLMREFARAILAAAPAVAITQAAPSEPVGDKWLHHYGARIQREAEQHSDEFADIMRDIADEMLSGTTPNTEAPSEDAKELPTLDDDSWRVGITAFRAALNEMTGRDGYVVMKTYEAIKNFYAANKGGA